MRPPLPIVIEPEALQSALGDPNLLVVDLCQAQTYRQLHVPGALHVNPAELVRTDPPISGLLPGKPQLDALFSRLGYRPDMHIVAYDDEGGGWAGRFLWTLDVIGHRHYSLLNGGLHSWYKEGYPTDSDVPEVSPSEVSLNLDLSVRATVDDILQAIETGEAKIWDARALDEYNGSRLTARRNGHIPGAHHLDWAELMDPARNLRLLPPEQLRAKLSSRGLHPGDAIITHCHSHHRSGLSYLVGKALGHPIRAYDGSWSEWGNRADTPVEN